MTDELSDFDELQQRSDEEDTRTPLQCALDALRYSFGGWCMGLAANGEGLSKLLLLCLENSLWGVWGNALFIKGLAKLSEHHHYRNAGDSWIASEHRGFVQFAMSFAAYYRAFVQQLREDSPGRKYEWMKEGDRIVDAMNSGQGVTCKKPTDYYIGARQLASKIAASVYKDRKYALMYVGIIPKDIDNYDLPLPDCLSTPEQMPVCKADSGETSDDASTAETKECRLSIDKDEKHLIIHDSLLGKDFTIKLAADAYKIITNLYNCFKTGTKQTCTSKKCWKNAFMHGDAKDFNSLEIFKEPKVNPRTGKPMGNLKSNKWRLRTNEEIIVRAKELKMPLPKRKK